MHRSTQIFCATSLIFLVGSVALCAGFYFIVKQQKAAYAEAVKSHGEAKSLQSSLQNLADTADMRASLVGRIVKDDDDAIRLLELIETVAKEQNVSLPKKNLTTVPAAGNFETIVIAVELEGARDAIMNTLRLFELLPYQVSIQKVQMSESDAVDGLWKANYEVRVTKFKKTTS